MSRYSYLREPPTGPLRHELIVLLGLLATATDVEILEAVRARGTSTRTVDRKYMDALYGRLEDIEAEQQRLVRALREKGVIT